MVELRTNFVVTSELLITSIEFHDCMLSGKILCVFKLSCRHCHDLVSGSHWKKRDEENYCLSSSVNIRSYVVTFVCRAWTSVSQLVKLIRN